MKALRFFFSRSAPPSLLSEHKNRFLKGKNYTPYQLVVEDYAPITQHYIDKYGLKNIAVLVNGATDFGQKKVSENISDIQKDIDLLENDALNYAMIIKYYWVSPACSIPGRFYLNKVDQKNSDFSIYYEELYDAIKDEFLDEYENIKELNLEQLKRLNQKCLDLKCREKLDEYRIKMLDDLDVRKSRVCLSKEQALEEIKNIQEHLTEDESIVYFFTNNRRIGPAHFEFVYIKKKEIIKPVHWFLDNSNIIDRGDLKNTYITDISDFISPFINPKHLQPQVDAVTCGTLGILYLKELLKNNTQQLRQFTLKPTVYQLHFGEIKKDNLFFPSPHVLRYSQSGFYNDVILAMIKNDNEFTLKFKGDKYKIRPLELILKDSIKFAKRKGDDVTAIENERMLENLPAFRKKWLSEYEKEIPRRKAMQGAKYNLYLAYSSRRMEALAGHLVGNTKKQVKNANHKEKEEKDASFERAKRNLHI